MMKNSSRHGFTLVELLIGIVMMVIVIGGIAFAVSSGFDLYTKADSNSVVISGVRFTADSLNRSVAPMLNSTNEIEILSEDSFTTASKTTSNDIHYIYLSTTGATKGSVIHRHKLLNGNMVNDVLEGSENIDKIGFSIPVSSVDQTENYILKIGIHGVNSNDIKAKLDLNIGKALYNNKPQKTSPSAPIVGGDYIGNVLRIKAGFYLEALNLYNYDSNENINETTKQKGIKIEAAYDLINQTITLEPMLDTSTIEWFISENVSGDYSQLYSGGSPLKGVSIDTTGTFYDENGSSFNIGVIKCKVTPEIKSQSGRSTVTGSPVWSKYVIITSETPSNNIIPGTGIAANDDWLVEAKNNGTTSAPNWKLTVTAGMKFHYNDEFYVAVKKITTPDQNAGSANHQELINGLAARSSGEGLVKVIGLPTEWEDVNVGDTFVRGNIIHDTDGNYYICKIAPNSTYTPILNQYNIRHPSAKPNEWFKIPNPLAP